MLSKLSEGEVLRFKCTTECLKKRCVVQQVERFRLASCAHSDRGNEKHAQAKAGSDSVVKNACSFRRLAV